MDFGKFIYLVTKSNIKSNLAKTEAKTIDDLFNLALNNYFKDEDIDKWIKLKNYYLKSFDKQIIGTKINTSNISSKELISKLYDTCDNISVQVNKMKEYIQLRH